MTEREHSSPPSRPIPSGDAQPVHEPPLSADDLETLDEDDLDSISGGMHIPFSFSASISARSLNV